MNLKIRLGKRKTVGPYAHYPQFISMGFKLNWADGVGPLKPILPGHDWIMVERLS